MLQDLVVTPWFEGHDLTPCSWCLLVSRAPTGGCSTESPEWSRGCSQHINWLCAGQAAASWTQRKKQQNIEEKSIYVFKSRIKYLVLLSNFSQVLLTQILARVTMVRNSTAALPPLPELVVAP